MPGARHFNSMATEVLTLLGAGPVATDVLARSVAGNANTYKARMSELRVSGLIVDKVELTDEGRKVLEEIEYRAKRNGLARKIPNPTPNQS